MSAPKKGIHKTPVEFQNGTAIELYYFLANGFENLSIRSQFKFFVFYRDNFECKTCGIRGTHVMKWKDRGDPIHFHHDVCAYYGGKWIMLTKDHIQPISKGGSRSSFDNHQCMCYTCNQLKADTYENP